MKANANRLAATICAITLVVLGPDVDACFMQSSEPVQVWLDHIDVEITDQVAVKTYQCTFKNPNPRAAVGGTCYMELEPGAQIDDMSVFVDGQEMKAEILDLQKANQVFQDIVKNGGSPALLEYYGNQLIQTQIPRVPANGTVTVKLQYTTVLKSKDGLVRLQMLNTNPKALMQPLKSAGVTVKIRSQTPLKNVYSPTHDIQVGEHEGWDVAVTWSQENYLPKHPFVLYYQLADNPVGASLVAHREPGEDGTFMLMLSPTIGNGVGRISDAQILPKDVVFCVDTSGSMLAGNKMEQARTALKYCIENLRPGDRFNIVDFSTTVRSFFDAGMVELNADSRTRALKYVERLEARGGTAIAQALEQSLKLLGRSSRLKMIVFATDGLPTIGERNPQKILESVAKANTEDVRIFAFGEGFDVNTKLLDFLALDHRGEADYILPEENISEKFGNLFNRIGSPIMADLNIDFEDLEVQEVYPQKIPDIYRGEQVIVYGRYSGSGPKTVRLTGQGNGQSHTLEFTLDFPEYSQDDRSAFVPRLWAGRKVDFLLTEIRKSEKPDQELITEATDLAKRYGIVTPYTSFLMAEDLIRKDPSQLARGLAGNFPAAAQPSSGSRNNTETGDVAVRSSQKLATFRREVNEQGAAGAFYGFADEGLKQAGRNVRSSLEAIRYIGNRTFYHSNGVWYDSLYEPQQVRDDQLKTITIGSREYFGLLAKDGRAAKYLALENVVVKIGQTWYRIQK